jgi:hypothetical protein
MRDVSSWALVGFFLTWLAFMIVGVIVADRRPGIDWFPVAPPIPVETAGPPTDFDG